MEDIKEDVESSRPLTRPDFVRQVSLREAQHRHRQTFFLSGGPLKVCKLCVFGIILPCFLVSMILYLRYRVYTETLYPLAMSDMRIVDNRISTTWCQRQIIKTNATFNAFMLPKTPEVTKTTVPMSMVRHLVLEDDAKEYWGFYLLEGSKVTISTCVRWPGASLIMIRGHKHLHDCAYIGDNSSEELEELQEAIREGVYVRPPSSNESDSDEAMSNDPTFMKRHRTDVQFHHPDHQQNNNTDHHLEDGLDMTDVTDPRVMESILNEIKQKASKTEPKVHVHRESTIGKGENANIHFDTEQQHVENRFRQNPNPNPLTSEELVQDILHKLSNMGDKGHAMLNKINDRFAEHKSNQERILSIRGRQYEKPEVKFDDSIDKARRRKRDLILRTAAAFNDNVEENENLAAEEGFVADGIADHHAIINETTLNDMSNSELWSSFSSSEEALLNCAGLILNLPLTPHQKCVKSSDEYNVEGAYLPNRVTYTVPTNGYYFFVFSSENEIQPNYIRVNFQIEKTIYNVTNYVSECSNRANKTDQCALPLHFFSNEKMVMELPISEGDEDLWNKEYVVVSICEPRTSIYVFIVILVPIIILMFAFQ